jgi:LacI family transcriptional regulator
VAQSSKDRDPGRPASLKIIAEHLGLSVAAISRVLNGAPAAKSIPKATQDRIFAAAKQLNYRPNVLARSLRRGRSMIVGVLVPEVSEGYATAVLAGIEQGLLQAEYFYFLISHHHREELIERSQRMMVDRSVDGMIAVDTPLLQHPHLPMITVSCPDEHEGITNIVLNHRRAAELAVDHLVGLGHREIAFIKGQAFSSDTPGHEPGYFATQRLLASTARFTALFTFNDVSAIGAVRALREAGLRVPQDVSVVGFDDVQSAAFQNPGLTTVRQPLRTMGMLAAEAVVRRITAPEEHPPAKQIVVDPELVVRDSTCPPPKRTRA